MNKELREALSQNVTWPPWKIAVDAVLNWGLAAGEEPDEAYEVGHIWDCLRRWRNEERDYGRNTYEHHVADLMKSMGYPAFKTWQETAAFILVAVYGDDDE